MEKKYYLAKKDKLLIGKKQLTIKKITKYTNIQNSNTEFMFFRQGLREATKKSYFLSGPDTKKGLATKKNNFFEAPKKIPKKGGP